MHPSIVSSLAEIRAIADSRSSNAEQPGVSEDRVSDPVWRCTGNVRVQPSTNGATNSFLTLGPGRATVTRRFAAGGLQVYNAAAHLRVDTGVTGKFSVRCYDDMNCLVMEEEVRTTEEMIGDKMHSVGIYSLTHPATAYVELAVEVSDGDGCLWADVAEPLFEKPNGTDRFTQQALCDLDESMQPLWRGTSVYHETVLLLSESGQPASGDLLFEPIEVTSVHDYALGLSFSKDADFTLDGRCIKARSESKIPSVADADFPGGDLPWFAPTGKHIVVSYRHAGRWEGPTPTFQGRLLPRTMHKLTRGLPLTIVTYGDSITVGFAESAYCGISPFMPIYPDLFKLQLSKIYPQCDITLVNPSLGGKTSEWADRNAVPLVASLNPDLVVIAFGMNDFWSISPDDFAANIQSIMRKIEHARPGVEFILVASMAFDPAYTTNYDYGTRMTGYAGAIHQFAGEGVAVLDMYAISKELFARKKPKDVINDPLHPNDYLARWYAQGLVALVDMRE